VLKLYEYVAGRDRRKNVHISMIELYYTAARNGELVFTFCMSCCEGFPVNTFVYQPANKQLIYELLYSLGIYSNSIVLSII